MKHNKKIVFLPGWGFSPHLFHSFAKQLERTAIFLELPLLNSLNLDKVVRQVASSIPEQSTIIAWSLGGLIALRLCALFPNKYQHLILISTTPKFMQDHNWMGIDMLTATQFISTFDKHPDSLLKRFINWVNYPNKNIKIKKNIGLKSFLQIKDYNKDSLSNYLKLLFYTDVRDEYATITIPTLHLIGGKEAIVRVHEEHLKELNHSVKLYTFKNAGHALFLTHQNECVHQIESFLKGDLNGR